MKKRLLIVFLPLLLACPGPAGGPIVDADASGVLEAAAPVVNGVCSLIEGVDPNGIVRTICATVDEIIAVIGYILTLRTASDAGLPATCTVLPGSTFCATKQEIAQGIVYIAKMRQARLLVDGGSK